MMLDMMSQDFMVVIALSFIDASVGVRGGLYSEATGITTTNRDSFSR
jgi:hypothetical protein